MFGLKPKKIKLENNSDKSVKLLTEEQMNERIFYAEKKEEARLKLMAILSNNTISITQPHEGYYEVRLDKEVLFTVVGEGYYGFGLVRPNRELNAPLRFHNLISDILSSLLRDDIVEILEMKLNATLNIDKHDDM